MCASVGLAPAVCVLPPVDDRNRPPKHAVVAMIDETSQIQARDRTPFGLPLTHGERGTAIGRRMRRRRREKLICFVSAVERAVPADKVVHAVAGDTVAH